MIHDRLTVLCFLAGTSSCMFF